MARKAFFPMIQMTVMVALLIPVETTTAHAQSGHAQQMTPQTSGDQRLAFIRAVGEAAQVLTDEQRKALLGQIPPPQLPVRRRLRLPACRQGHPTPVLG